MDSIVHSKECINSQHAVELWKETWPNYCHACGAWGGFQYNGSYDEPPSFYPCDKCLGDCRCPRCGKDSLTILQRLSIKLGHWLLRHLKYPRKLWLERFIANLVSPLDSFPFFHCNYCDWDEENPNSIPCYTCECYQDEEYAKLLASEEVETEWESQV